MTEITLRDLAEILTVMETDESFYIELKQEDTDFFYSAGVRCIYEFESKLVIIGVHGGGWNACIHIDEEEEPNIEQIEEELREVLGDFTIYVNKVGGIQNENME
jgi:hypothetical protein